MMVEQQQSAYTTKEISELLEIGTSTLRKWCLALEKNENLFLRTDANKRLFTDHDIIILKHFKELVQVGNMPLESASSVVTSRFKKETFSTGTPTVLQENKDKERSLMRSDEVIDDLINHIKLQQEHMERQERFNKDLIDRLDKQQSYIEERLNERDKSLTESLRKMQRSHDEIKQLNAAATEKKGFLAKLFGK